MTRYEDFPEIFWEKVKEELLPTMVTGLQNTLAAYDIDPENFDNYTIGTTAYRILYNRLAKACRDSKYFSGSTKYNRIEISANVYGKNISFRVPRVDENRIPKASKSIKIHLEQQLFLFEEAREQMANKGMYILGFDIDALQGIGDISFDFLTAIAKKEYQANTIAVFSTQLASGAVTIHTPETIRRGKIGRAASGNLAKKQA